MTAPVRTPGTAVARSDVRAPAPFVQTTPIGKILLSNDARAQIQALIPHGVDYERVVLEVHRAAVKEPKILQCTQASIIMAVGQAVQTGLEIGRTIHLVPVDGKLQAWNDYKGDIELVIWSGAARHVDAQCVYENDHFEYQQGSNPAIVHRPATKNRGALIGAYCIAWLNGSGTLLKIVFMPIEDVNKVRAKSRGWKNERECPPWYAIKSAVHLNTKMLPKNRRLATVLAMMDNRESADVIEGEGADLLDAANPLEDAPPLGFATTEVQTETSASEAAQSEADVVVESDDVGDDFVDEAMTIETALAMPLPGGSKAFNGKGGTPLGQLSPRMIEPVQKWIDKKITDAEALDGDGTAPPIHYRLRNACARILEARKVAATQSDPRASAPDPVTATSDQVADAITRTPKPVAAATDQQRRFNTMVRDPKFADGDGPSQLSAFKALWTAATSVEGQSSVLAEMEAYLALPF